MCLPGLLNLVALLFVMQYDDLPHYGGMDGVGIPSTMYGSLVLVHGLLNVVAFLGAEHWF